MTEFVSTRTVKYVCNYFGLYETSSIKSDILLYELIPRC